MNKKTSLMLSILGIISIVLITVGITYAFFNYAKEGTTDNMITSGSITFIYEEVDKQGAGILIENAYPMLDENGKILSGTNEVFNFTVKSKTGSGFAIPYVITARKDNNSTLDEEAVRIYLTEVDGTNETEILLDNYNELQQTDLVSSPIVERIIHTDTVPQGSTNYEKNYRLRMWVDSDIKFSPTQDEDGNDVYEYNNKTFKITVNVYADAEVVTVPTQPIAYYEFGTPTTNSTTDYTTLGYNVFSMLQSDGSTGVCINDNGLFCLKTGEYDNSVASLKAHFGEDKCTDNGSSFDCVNGNFSCNARSVGGIYCFENATYDTCDANSNGVFTCY